MISTKGRYGLRVMLDLAEHREEGYIALKEIAQRQDISKKYLEIIIRLLAESGMVEGLSGKGGGYRLTRAPEKYPLGEILEALEGPLTPVVCLKADAPACPRETYCRTLPLWRSFDTLVHDFFYSQTLAQLLNPKENAE